MEARSSEAWMKQPKTLGQGALYAPRKPRLKKSALDPAECCCPRLFLAQQASNRGAFTIGSNAIRELTHEARELDSQPGMLLQFDGDLGGAEQHWAVIPFALFKELLAATQKVPARRRSKKVPVSS